MLPNTYLATIITLSLWLSRCTSDQNNSEYSSDIKEEKPRYLWRLCDNSSTSNVYQNQFEVDNIFKNDTIMMEDYAGQVISTSNKFSLSKSSLGLI